MKRTYTDKYPEAIIQSKKEKEAGEKQVAAVIDPNETKNGLKINTEAVNYVKTKV